MNLILAFATRDALIEKGYKFDYAGKAANLLFQITIFYFLGRIIKGYDYFSFVLVGLLFSRLFQFWLGVFAENIRMEQYWGTAESLFMSPSRPAALVISSASGKFLMLTVEIALFFAAGKYLLGASIPAAGALMFVPLFLFACLVFSGLGMVAAAFITLYKRGDPVNMFVPVMLDLLSGVYFPVAVLPERIRPVSAYLPTTQMLDAWRAALSGGPACGKALMVLGIWAVLFWVLGILCFNYAFDKARVRGEIGTY